jgi:hypothetical protein
MAAALATPVPALTGLLWLCTKSVDKVVHNDLYPSPTRLRQKQRANLNIF